MHPHFPAQQKREVFFGVTDENLLRNQIDIKIHNKPSKYDKSPAASPAGLLPGEGAHEMTGRTSK